MPAFPSACLLKFKHLWKMWVRSCQTSLGEQLRSSGASLVARFTWRAAVRGAWCQLGVRQKASSNNLKLKMPSDSSGLSQWFGRKALSRG